jgi:hypothetical protein
VAVYLPQRHDATMGSKRPRPGERVVIVGVDERAVDVE